MHNCIVAYISKVLIAAFCADLCARLARTFVILASVCGGDGWYDDCIVDGTYYNLLSRLEEIKNELENE